MTSEVYPISLIMPGLVPGIHVFTVAKSREDLDARDKRGHDGKRDGGDKPGHDDGVAVAGLSERLAQER